MGDILAGPLRGEAGLLTAEIDTDELVRARYDYDVVGHYARRMCLSWWWMNAPNRACASPHNVG
jgi:hypothetical protein